MILPLFLIAVTPVRAADNLSVERLATCQDSWLDWKNSDPVRLKRFAQSFQSDFFAERERSILCSKIKPNVAGLPAAVELASKRHTTGTRLRPMLVDRWARAQPTGLTSAGETRPPLLPLRLPVGPLQADPVAAWRASSPGLPCCQPSRRRTRAQRGSCSPGI
jgi:hypothetical protein